jgi:mycothiol synthase
VLVTPVVVRGAELEQARAFLARLERSSGVPPVDEDEQRRLAGSPPIRDRDWSWGGHLALSDGTPVAYAGIRLPPQPPSDVSACVARIDLALDRSHGHASEALVAALDDARGHVDRRAGRAAPAGATPGQDQVQAHVQGRVQAWLRGATALDLAAARLAGFRLVKRLHVMAAPLGPDRLVIRDGAQPSDGLRIRAYDPDAPADADAVVALLSAAYPGSEGGWDAPGFAVRRATDWFRAEDLLLLEEHGADGMGGGLLGVHWTKRRGEGVGEVHNLALDPSARGRGLGGVLLDAGLAHLAAVGCHEVILWVDADNTPALELYRSRGFVPRWDDVALVG